MARMRVVRKFGFVLAALALPSLALAQAAPPPSAPPPATVDPATVDPATVELPAEAPPAEAPPAERARPAVSLAPEVALATADTGRERAPASEPRYGRHSEAWPLTLEARFGFNARLGSSFSASAQEQLFDTDYALGAFLAWNPEYALGVELERSGLGRARDLSGQNSIDAEYSAWGAWLAARVFPIRRERLDLFVQLRVGLVLQHVDALGTRLETSSITVPARSFSCSEGQGPGFGLGGALGAAYFLSPHVSFVSRLDATGQRLSGDPIAGCANGIGSVASVSGTLGLAFELETAKP